MSESSVHVNKKISTFGFFSFCILLVYTILNSEQMYYQMGYASIIYVVIAGLIFFIPYSFAVAEMGSAYSDKKGGVYSWLSEIIGEKYAMVTTLIWFSTRLIGGLAISGICITFSTLFFGKDISETWHLFGLSNQLTTTIIGAVWLLFWMVITTRGIKTVEILSKISMGLFFYGNAFVIIISFIVFWKHGFHFAQPFAIHSIRDLFTSPNPDYHSIFSILGFLVFAIMSLGGMESAVGLVDQVKDPHKTVPKAIFLTVIIMLVLTIVVIIGNGMVVNWKEVYGNGHINLYNFSVYMSLKYNYSFGIILGMSHAHALVFAKWYLIVSAWIGALGFLQIPLSLYYPIKQLVEGMPEGMLPRFVTKINKHGFPANALFAQCGFMIGFAFLVVLLFKNNANQIYNYTTFMVTISSVIPWGLITFGYIKFKLNDNIPKHYEFFNKKFGVGLNIISLCAVIFSIVFSVIQPWTVPGGAEQGILMIIGPLVFGILGFLIAWRFERAKKRELLK